MEENPSAPLRTAQMASPSVWERHGRALLAALFWGGLLVAYYVYAQRNELTPIEAVRAVDGWLRTPVWGVALYLLIYALRPLIFFPATVLTVLGGYVFGVAAGILLTVIGSNASAMVAYLVGRFFGHSVLEGDQAQTLLGRYTDRLRRNSFEGVLIMRLLFLPYDLVNYLCGFLRIGPVAFLVATALGSVPGTISFVLAGASITGELSNGEFGLDARALVASVAILVVSLALSRMVRRRERT